jgi:hypothetical protein
MSKSTHDTFPIRLPGQRVATLELPVDLTAADATRICCWVNFIAECSADHNQEPGEVSHEPASGTAAKGEQQ